MYNKRLFYKYLKLVYIFWDMLCIDVFVYLQHGIYKLDNQKN